MKIKPWLLALGLGAGLGLSSAGTFAQLPDRPVKVGVLTDMSGTYSAMGGAGSVVAAQMAIDDCLAAECKGMKVELVSADNQNKADVAANKAREWFDRDNVDAIADLTNSAAALAVQKLAMDKQRVVLFSGPATTRLTNEDCSPTGFHWMFDTYSQSAATARAVVGDGGKSWYFITVDYAFGHSLEKDAADIVKTLGGTVVGQSRHPLNASDYASFLLQAQSSKAQVVALANGGQDTVNVLKQAREFGIVQRGQKLAALLVFLSDVHALGLNTAQGLLFTDGFYWDFDDASRTWSDRFQKKYKNLKPTMVQAGVYSSVLHYLRSVAAAKSVDAKVVAQKMRELPIRDPIMHNASIRPDGRVIHDMYLFRVKSPAESKGPWDYYTKVATVPATEAFQPLSKSTCSLVKTNTAAK
ncbi:MULTISPECIES: ABC transporter substrate-binding protein [Pandoraea]|uniref:ABC transporter permease n=2 Tax=Pandoraea TaxID=93217 RepID=A0A239SUW1_9BURK|nr:MULTISPECIES: ABC transporter substrate-binding protein [Pandoraea]SNU88524.1 urea ABC transporter, urea binding protein [Pandoraea sputorum]VVE56962.1 ABC transporter permease [Pandoraea sputorum]VVE63824.1 ABC transporter permease [Pandoraea anapnoica]VVE79051.1 ABC transporter permease [Pandoraea sputorum]VVE83775.1 ABC transporter permease [Pandoraea sputorum]